VLYPLSYGRILVSNVSLPAAYARHPARASCQNGRCPRGFSENRDMFQTAIPVIQVSSSSAAEAFYCKGLGFTLLSSWRADDARDDPRYMTLARDGAKLHVHSFQSGTLGAAVYVFVDDVNSLYAELVSKGILVSPPIDQEWGSREIVVRDADRNVMTFGQRLLHTKTPLPA
jgi:uncharacterized glyoxalase superfamily protein PhnB